MSEIRAHRRKAVRYFKLWFVNDMACVSLGEAGQKIRKSRASAPPKVEGGAENKEK